MSDAILGHGSIFQVESLDFPGTFISLSEVFNIAPPSFTVDQVDITHWQSPGHRREFASGWIDSGECSLEVNFIPGSETDLLLNDIVDARLARTCRVVFPNTAYVEFRANLVSYDISDPNDDRMTATVTWRVTGTVTWVTPTNSHSFNGSGSLRANTTQIEFPSTISLGIWLDPSDKSTMWQDAAATVPVTASGQPVRLIQDKSGNGNHYLAPSDAARPMYRVHAPSGIARLVFDGVDDQMSSVLDAGHATTGHIAVDEFDFLIAAKNTVSSDDHVWVIEGGNILGIFTHDPGGTRSVLRDSGGGFNFVGNTELVGIGLRTVMHVRFDGGNLDLSCDTRVATQDAVGGGGTLIAGFNTEAGRLGNGLGAFVKCSVYGLIGRKTVFSAPHLAGLKAWLNDKCTIGAPTSNDALVNFVLTAGESNASGLVDLATLTTAEKEPRPEVQILHNYTFLFETLNVPENSFLDHAGHSDNQSAGIEVGLANLQEDSAPWGNILYLLKAGQGGSLTANWATDYVAISGYFHKFAQRFRGAIDHFEDNNLSPSYTAFVTIGINDHLGSSLANYSADMITISREIREILRRPETKIYFTQFNTNYAYGNDINALYPPVIADNPYNFLLLSGSASVDLTTTHWNRAGFQTIAELLTEASVGLP